MKNDTSKTFEASGNDGSNDFPSRMSLIADMMGNATALARAAGISQGGIRNYFGTGEPSRPVLVALAKAAGVSIEWLATGRGPMAAEAMPQDVARESPGEYNIQPPGPVDKQRLKAAIETADIILKTAVKPTTTAQKAAFIVALYDYLPDGEISQQARDNIVKLFQSITEAQ